MLTDSQQEQVRFYLGVSTLFRYRNPRLEGVWATLSSDAEANIISILSQLQVIDTKLFGTGGVPGDAANAAGVKALEEIQFAGNSGRAVEKALCALGRKLVSRLSSIVGVPVYADVYGADGWPGDSYSGFGGGGTFGLG